MLSEVEIVVQYEVMSFYPIFKQRFLGNEPYKFHESRSGTTFVFTCDLLVTPGEAKSF